MIKIKKGLDLPITGQPRQVVSETKTASTVAVLGGDYVGMKPTMAIRVADSVKKGQVLFTDKKMPDVKYTAPAAGKIIAIPRGAKRALLSVVIQVSGSAEVTFQSHSEGRLSALKREQIVDQLLESGLWTSLRSRPFSKTADPAVQPHAIFVTCTDTNPLAPDMAKILENQERDFATGLKIVSRLTEGKVYICKAPNVELPKVDVRNLEVEEFDGPHPAGLVGTHIHFLAPVSRKRLVWHVGMQDVIAIGKLFTTGKLSTDRIVSLAGPGVRNPRLIRTQLGASVKDITKGELVSGENRAVSGSVFSGHNAEEEAVAFLGRYHQQVTVLRQTHQRSFLGWLSPGFNRYSVKNIVASRFIPGKRFDFDTSVNGEVRAILPSYNYERIMPLDIMPLFLLRALAVDDVEEAEALGCLELDEEDLALCALVCPSKQEFGPLLRRNLTTIEKEG